MGVNMFHEYKGRQVTIMCCNECNSQCRHCYISYEGNFTGESLYHTACALQQNGYVVSLNGTETLMHREYLKTYKLVNQKIAMTNGLVFENDFDYLDEVRSFGITRLNISYHFDLQDQISSISRGYLIDLWEKVIARGIKLQINCTLSKINMHKIHQYCDEALSYGANRIRFTNLINQGKANNLKKELFLDRSDIDLVIENINSARKSFNKESLCIERCGSFGPCGSMNFHCPAGTGNVFLTPDFKIYPCLFLTQQSYAIGFYQDGMIYIKDGYSNDGNCCLALNALNKNH